MVKEAPFSIFGWAKEHNFIAIIAVTTLPSFLHSLHWPWYLNDVFSPWAFFGFCAFFWS
jgi:hypothetical protein